MVTLVLQSLVTLLLVGVSVLALLTARRISDGSAPAAHVQGWAGTGVVLLVYSLDKLVQGAWGIAAYVQGPDSGVYTGYLAAAPQFNHGRTLLMFVLYGLLGWICLVRPISRLVPLGLLLSAAALLAGAGYGVAEGPLQSGRHFPTTAVVDLAGFVLLASLLFAAMLRDAMDRLLWALLATYGVTSIVGVLFLSAMAWLDVGGWSPPFWSIELLRFLLAAVMFALAYARHAAAVRGRPVRGLLPRDLSVGRPTLA